MKKPFLAWFSALLLCLLYTASAAAQAVPAGQELLGLINRSGHRLDQVIGLLPAQCKAFCGKDSAGDALLDALESIRTGIDQLDPAKEPFKSLKDFAAASPTFSDIGKLRNLKTEACLDSVSPKTLISALKKMQAMLKSIRTDLDALWFETKKVESLLAAEKVPHPPAPPVVVAAPAPAPEKPAFDKTRANAIWNRLLTQESTLERLQSAPRSWDEASGVVGKVAQAPSRLLHWVDSDWGRSAKLRETYIATLVTPANELPIIKASLKEAAAQGPDALQARFSEFDGLLDGTDAQLNEAGHLWSTYTDEHYEAGENLKTGLTYVRDGAVVFEVVAGTVATGGGLLEVAGGGTFVAGAVGSTPVAIGLGGSAVVHYGIFEGASSSTPSSGSPGQPGGGKPAAPTEIDIDITPEAVQPVAPLAPAAKPAVLVADQGNWDVKDKDKDKDKQPEKKPEPVAPKPKPAAPKPAAPKPKPVVPAPAHPADPSAPALGEGNIFGRSGPHLAGSVGGIGGDQKDEIKCDADSQKTYRDNARKNKSDMSNWPDIIQGQQQLYFCKINSTDFSNDPRAIFLSRFGLRAAAIGQVNLVMACLPENMKKIKAQLKGIGDDIKTLETVDASPELKKLGADFDKTAHDLSCSDLAALVFSDGDPRLQQINADLCAWKKVTQDPAHGGRPGMWLGISYALVQCPR